MLKQLNEVADLNSQTASNFFTKSYKKYLHLGAKFNDTPILVNLNDIIQYDEVFNNEGRETPHTPLEWQRLATDFGNGIKPWLDLPIVVKNTDKDMQPVRVAEIEKVFAEKILNQKLIEISDIFQIPCVGTHDVRFVNEEDYEIHDIKRAILLKENVNALSRVKTEYKHQYMISTDELVDKLLSEQGLHEDHENTEEFKQKVVIL